MSGGLYIRTLHSLSAGKDASHDQKFAHTEQCLAKLIKQILALGGEGKGLLRGDSAKVCFCCSRTTAGPVVRATIASFLRTYTTPTSILEADRAEVEAAINTLGLQVGHWALKMHA